MKTIGITQGVRVYETTGQTRESIDVQWHRWASLSGFVLRPLSAYGDFTLQFKDLDGFIFSGGGNVTSVEDMPLNRDRDHLERLCLQHADKNNLPVFGVCRGLQFLMQEAGSKIVEVKNHVAVRHDVTIQFPLGSTSQRLNVNSYHNYSVDVIPQNYQIIAKADDGVIEGVYSQMKRHLAIMWHPERENEPRDFEIQILRDHFL